MDRNLLPSKKLDFDIITDNILQILPAKSLIRFMLACKTWYYVIKSPQFIVTHLNVNGSDDKCHQILILGKHLCYVIENPMIIRHIELDFDIDYLKYWNTPIESCNGLVFIPILGHYGREYLLWNPSIKKSKKVESKVHSPYYEMSELVMFNYEIFGLGFHEISNDHRVVRILYVIDKGISGIAHVPIEVDVYSLCTDSWHRVDSSPGRLIGSSRSVFINGVIHWLSSTQLTLNPEDDLYESILLFDFEDECFKEAALPEDLHYTIDRTIAFNAFKGSLAVIILEVTANCTMFVLWVMTDYGVMESWIKKYRIITDETHIKRWPLGFLRCGISVYCEKLYEKITIVVCDVDSGEAQNIEWLMYSTEVVDFTDSLVLFEG